ncbi:MAG: triose-phosphate isomerase [bacterium]|nr:triose-phosphate isomerase [bacterium]
MGRKCIIAGNWKMNLLPDQAFDLVDELKHELKMKPGLEVVLLPQAPLLTFLAEWTAESGLTFGAQTSSGHREGAHTGDLSPELLQALGCRYALAGHSERRQDHHESDAEVAAQAKAQIEAGMRSIVCVGETLAERESGQHIEKIQNQIKAVYTAVEPSLWGEIVLAYEPIWAIGTGKTASPEQAEEIHKMIRNLLEEIQGIQMSQATPILYGGSVKGANAADILGQTDIDGLLVGGASLKADEFISIIQAY